MGVVQRNITVDRFVIPAKAGIRQPLKVWMPAFASMTDESELVFKCSKDAASHASGTSDRE